MNTIENNNITYYKLEGGFIKYIKNLLNKKNDSIYKGIHLYKKKCSKNNNNATSNKLVDIHIPITKLNLKRSYEWNTNPQEIRSYVNPLYFSKNISSSMFSTTTTTTDNITSTKVTTIITNQK